MGTAGSGVDAAVSRALCGLQEIGGYAWHKVADLPASRDEGNQTFLSEDGVKHKFFMVRLGLLLLCFVHVCVATGLIIVCA
jgi:hypothetical protein